MKCILVQLFYPQDSEGRAAAAEKAVAVSSKREALVKVELQLVAGLLMRAEAEIEGLHTALVSMVILFLSVLHSLN